jgi:hypothetical protein
MKVYYEGKKLDDVISREEFVSLDPATLYDNLLCCGAEAVIFWHVDTGHVAVEDVGGGVDVVTDAYASTWLETTTDDAEVE